MQLDYNAGVLRDFATGMRILQDPSRMRQAMNLAGAVMKSQIQENFRLQRDPLTGQAWAPLSYPRPQGGSKILYRTGQLRNSLNAAIPQVTDDSAKISTNVIYANIQNQGGTIRASNARRARPSRNPHLAIPITREAVRYGSASTWWSAMASKRPYFRGKALGYDVRGQFVAHFVLAKSVTIPARPFMRWGETQAKKIAEVVAFFFRDEFRAATRPQGAPSPAPGSATP